ncbi:MAG: exodeoxyribonuclease VII small subunit [Chloroflexi bacterium]|nr:exodeoxyribonuclease VII small subunit [Chloroflexota bacterium]
MNDMPDIEALSFEEAFRELEDLVERMETGNLPLEETIRLFERGSLLARHCQNLLDKAELKLQQLTASPNGEATIAPFDEGSR